MLSDNVQPSDLRAGDVRQLAWVCASLPLGATFFAAIVAALSIKTPPTAFSDMSPIALRVVVFAEAIWVSFAYLAAAILFPRVVARARAETDAGRQMSALKSAYIVRAALLEMASFVALAVCFLAGLSGAFRSNPALFLASLPYFIQVAAALSTFPTPERLADTLSGR